MKRYVVLHKEVGETPLMAIQRFKSLHKLYKDVAASYAGRLDPMASGKLLVLLGDECKKQDRYIGLDKEYEIEILLGAGSDTGDALGYIEGAVAMEVEDETFRSALRKEHGAHERAYPAFSSKTVAGKPLFTYALAGTLDTIHIPTHTERIHRIRWLRKDTVSKAELQKRIATFLSRVPKTDEPSKVLGADFRIEAVRASWDTFFAGTEAQTFTVLRLQVTVASGTYMRSLAGRLGASLGTKALALSIHRTKIGRVWRGLWLRSF